MKENTAGRGKIKVTYKSLDHWAETKYYLTVLGLRKFVERTVGMDAEICEDDPINGTYAKSRDGVGRIWIRGANIYEVFKRNDPSKFPEKPRMIDIGEHDCCACCGYLGEEIDDGWMPCYHCAITGKCRCLVPDPEEVAAINKKYIEDHEASEALRKYSEGWTKEENKTLPF